MPVIAAVAGLDLVVLAAIGLVIVIGLYMLFRPVLAGALAQIPVVGGFVAQRTDQLLLAMYVSGLDAALAALGPAADLFRRIAGVESTLARFVAGAIDNTFNTVWRLRYQIIPAELGRQAAYALQLAQAAEGYALQLGGQVEREAAADAARVADYARQLAGAEGQYALDLVQAAEQRALAREQAILGYVQTVVLDEARQALAQVQVAERYAEQLALDVRDAARAGDLDAERYAQNLGIQVEDYARALERAAVGHADQAVAAAAAAAAAATGAVAARVTDIEDSPCQRFCSPLGDLGQLLQGLEDAGFVAILLGLIAEVRHDPGAVQQVLRQDLVPLGRDALAGLGLGG